MSYLGPQEMRRILAVTDALGIHRESVAIPLARQGTGDLRIAAGRVEIVAPEAGDLEAWLGGLAARLHALDLRGVRRAE